MPLLDSKTLATNNTSSKESYKNTNRIKTSDHAKQPPEALQLEQLHLYVFEDINSCICIQ